MNDYESFRPRFEAIIKEGKLESYIAERVSGREENSALDPRWGREGPEQILWHFGKDHPEIYTVARNMLRRIGKDKEKAQDGEYGFGLSFLLANHDAESPSIALDLLLSKGRPLLSQPYFAERTELGLLNLVANCDYNNLPEDKKKQTEVLLIRYVENWSEFSEMATSVLKKLKS